MSNKILKFFSIFILAFSLVACGSSAPKEEESKEEVSAEVESEEVVEETEKEEATEVKTLKIGASPNVVEVVKSMKDSLAERGYDLEVVAFDDIVQPNIALIEGSLDGNLFQHKPFLESFNADNNENLVFVEPLFGGYTALYSTKWDSVEAIPDGAKLGIFQDTSNQHRALVLGESIGLFTLGEVGETGLYSILDIKDNPKNIELIPLESGGTLTNSVDELDGAFNQGTTMYLADKDPMSFIAREEDNTKFAIGLVVSPDRQGEEWVKDFIEAFRTEDTKAKINDFYKGSYVFFD